MRTISIFLGICIGCSIFAVYFEYSQPWVCTPTQISNGTICSPFYEGEMSGVAGIIFTIGAIVLGPAMIDWSINEIENYLHKLVKKAIKAT